MCVGSELDRLGKMFGSFLGIAESPMETIKVDLGA